VNVDARHEANEIAHEAGDGMKQYVLWSSLGFKLDSRIFLWTDHCIVAVPISY
jgi:hypothetical protein